MVRCSAIAWGPLMRETEYYPVTDALFEAGTPIAGHLEFGHDFPPWHQIFAEKAEDLVLTTTRHDNGLATIEFKRADGTLLLQLVKQQHDLVQEPYLVLREVIG